MMTGAASMTLANDSITLDMPAMDVVWLKVGPDNSTSGDGLSAGAQAGIAIGVIAGVGLLGGGAVAAGLFGWWYYKKKKDGGFFLGKPF